MREGLKAARAASQPALRPGSRRRVYLDRRWRDGSATQATRDSGLRRHPVRPSRQATRGWHRSEPRPRSAIEGKANAAVTLKLEDVPLETAVRLLSEVADLRAVRMSNVLFVTTPERGGRNCDRMRRSGAGRQRDPIFPGGLNPQPIPGIAVFGGIAPAQALPVLPAPPPAVEKPAEDRSRIRSDARNEHACCKTYRAELLPGRTVEVTPTVPPAASTRTSDPIPNHHAHRTLSRHFRPDFAAIHFTAHRLPSTLQTP